MSRDPNLDRGPAQRVLVTGAASGLGRAIVEGFLTRGASVVGLDRSRERLDALSASLGGAPFVAVEGDVTNWEDNRRAVEAAVDRFDGLDCFIGNAGLWDFGTRLLDLPVEKAGEAFDEVFAVNVKGYLLGARAAAPALAEGRQPSMIFTLSNAALYPDGGGVLYVTSKHAGVGLTKQLAHELAPDIRVNAVAPAGMITELTGPPALGRADERMRDNWDPAVFASRVPLGFTPDPSDYVGPYLFLADQAASGTMTGVVLPAELGLGVRGIRALTGGGARNA
ncbi:SDR family NAD(P)-dependent oxidoreductase [Maritimibacter sp. UBA3975]|uniref:SDR family NAD(P)-dependent oxidoreductase n=1 Tax=Maritimibacter sp. UBA3975 TaxID=1946833 RepID=UPI000C0AF543|nr:SDR family NAD(P)-dependent oxidoreductase [Maritimibacter sp. UBA3975]MAM62235.1 3-(cis-5,6-dihydroxycyclohexa-1,3-dien-1-yl)propanoate dehydrogenase [Maritimibacter sp.]